MWRHVPPWILDFHIGIKFETYQWARRAIYMKKCFQNILKTWRLFSSNSSCNLSSVVLNNYNTYNYNTYDNSVQKLWNVQICTFRIDSQHILKIIEIIATNFNTLRGVLLVYTLLIRCMNSWFCYCKST